jgi:RND family efflux transporter MFP subunit
VQPHQREDIPDDTSRTETPATTAMAPGTDRRIKRAALIFVCVLAAGFIGVRVLRFFDERSLARAGELAYSAPPPVDVVVATEAGAGRGLVLPGQTAAWYESTIYARVDGYVAAWSADIGDHVRKGQVLATIETPELDAQLAAARAQRLASEAQVAARQAEAEFARTTHERWRDSPKGVVSDQEREEKKTGYDAALARLYAAKAQVALDQARVDQYAALARFKQVTAPFDGTVSERRIDVGNLVTAGSTAATTPLYKVVQDNPLRVFVDVPQSAASDLMKPGVPAEVRSADAGQPITAGRIARSAESINSQARTMRVEVDIANADHRLIPGLYVNVAFGLPPKGAVEVPAAALLFRSGGAQVARVGADGKVSFENVTIARDDGGTVELASGVRPGDRLVLNISSQIAPGATVLVNAPEAAAAPASVAKR